MRISTQAKLISTALVAVAIAAPIAHGESGGTLPSGSYSRLETGKGFSFKAPSYWNAAPSYWRTVERTLTPRTPRVSVNHSLGVPPQYLGGGTPAVPGTPRASVNRSLGVPPQYLGTGTQTKPRTPPGGVNHSLGVPAEYLGTGTPTEPRTPLVAVNHSLGVPPEYLASSEQASTGSSGFDWLAAGVGAAFIAGLGALGLAVFFAVRRRHGLAQLEV